jgi:hypothetical protein
MTKAFGIGRVLGTGFRVWAKNFLPFMVITALVYSPVLIWKVSVVHGTLTDERVQATIRAIRYGAGLTMMLNIIVSAALTYGVVMELQGQRASIGACITTGIVRFFPALGVALLTMLCVTGGCFLLVIPGLVMMCMLYIATQCSVLERPGVMGALRRSRELTQGHKLEIFGLLMILGGLNYGLQHLVETVMLTERDDLPGYVYAVMVQEMVVGSISAVMASVAYYFLRAEKEGTSAAELAAIFD